MKFNPTILRGLLAITLLTAATGIFSGCATHPKKISAAYVSPLKYKDYDCDQILMEMDHISHRTNVLYQNLRSEANADTMQTGVGLLLFWPTLLLVEGGDGPEAAEYAQLKGEYEALRQMAIKKKCDLALLPPSPEKIIEKAEKSSRTRK